MKTLSSHRYDDCLGRHLLTMTILVRLNAPDGAKETCHQLSPCVDESPQTTQGPGRIALKPNINNTLLLYTCGNIKYMYIHIISIFKWMHLFLQAAYQQLLVSVRLLIYFSTANSTHRFSLTKQSNFHWSRRRILKLSQLRTYSQNMKLPLQCFPFLRILYLRFMFLPKRVITKDHHHTIRSRERRNYRSLVMMNEITIRLLGLWANGPNC